MRARQAFFLIPGPPNLGGAGWRGGGGVGERWGRGAEIWGPNFGGHPAQPPPPHPEVQPAAARAGTPSRRPGAAPATWRPRSPPACPPVSGLGSEERTSACPGNSCSVHSRWRGSRRRSRTGACGPLDSCVSSRAKGAGRPAHASASCGRKCVRRRLHRPTRSRCRTCAGRADPRTSPTRCLSSALIGAVCAAGAAASSSGAWRAGCAVGVGVQESVGGRAARHPGERKSDLSFSFEGFLTRCWIFSLDENGSRGEKCRTK